MVYYKPTIWAQNNNNYWLFLIWCSLPSLSARAENEPIYFVLYIYVHCMALYSSCSRFPCYNYCRAFQFPGSMYLEPEYWAESGQLDEVEQHELNITDNELFTVQPKRGLLKPGAATTVIASFKHTHIGTSRLPVLLKINRGREILVRKCTMIARAFCNDIAPHNIRTYVPVLEFLTCILYALT